MAEESSYGEENINGKEKIAYIIQCSNTEQYIVNSTHRSHTAKIEKSIAYVQVAKNFIYGSYTHNQDCPNAKQKHSEK